MLERDELMKCLPDVDYVRQELGRNLRERALLRRLLKLAEDKARVHQQRRTNAESGVPQ